jgi:hypothetical protein
MFMRIRALCLALLLVVLAACGVPAAPSAVPTSPPTTAVPTSPPNAAIPGSALADIPALSAWSLGDPVDPALPPLIEPYEGRYRLKPDWDISAINYLYEWGGLGTPSIDVQRITRTGAEYQRDGVALEAQDVQRLVAALDQLYLSQSWASWQSHTDDYPSWSVELQGSDGMIISLGSSSTGNPGHAPWVVRYNGRTYLHYDAAIGAALDTLFSGQENTPAGSVFPGGSSTDEVQFETFGVFGGAILHVRGLFPFGADLSASSAVISGSIAGPEAIGMESVSLVQSIQRVRLGLPDGSSVDCTLAPDSDREQATAIQCPVGVLQPGQRFSLPISVQYTDVQGALQESSGMVAGIWGVTYDYIAQPLPAELAAALGSHPPLTDLLRDHILIEAVYVASIPPGEPQSGTRSGSVRLLGQTTVGGATVRYTVNTPFQLEDGVLTGWSLDRGDVERMLATIGGLPVTQRVLGEDPQAIIDLWYAEAGGPPAIDNLGGLPTFSSQDYALDVSACGSVPGAKVPSDSQPLQLFSFNATKQTMYMFGTHGNQFMLLNDNRVVVVELDLDLIGEPPYGLLPDRSLQSLIPAGLDPSPQRGFARIWLDTDSYFSDYPSLTIDIPADATPAEQAVYQRQIDALGAAAAHEGEQRWTIDKLTLVLDADGRLQPTPCP